MKATGHPAPQPKKRVATVISETRSEGLQIQGALDQSDRIFALYRQAFTAFSDDEVALLDGVIMEPNGNRRR